MMYWMLKLISVLFFIVINCVFESYAQLPLNCTVTYYDHSCCPSVPGLGICGGQLRGSCENPTYPSIPDCGLSNLTNKRYCRAERVLKYRGRRGLGIQDLRYRWPYQIFRRICICKENYGGIDCMQCKPGYRKDNNDQCVQHKLKTLSVRKNFLNLPEAEKREFLDILELAKNSDRVLNISYAVPVQQPVLNSRSFVRVSLYDAFTSYHYFSNRDKDLTNCTTGSAIARACSERECIPDFAHWGPAFFTWHRGYLLCFENEIKRMLSRMDRRNKIYTEDNFALHYWDWTGIKSKRSKIWNYFGRNMENWTIAGRFENWTVICKNHKSELCDNGDQLCNPTRWFGSKILRNIGGSSGRQCLAKTSNDSNESSPSNKMDIFRALQEKEYDKSLYGFDHENGGFRSTIEGFEDVGNKRLGVCDRVNSYWKYFELHNRLHVYVGGTMSDIIISSNDPIFYLHHSNVDRMYETWLQKYNIPSYQPQHINADVLPGHNYKEPLVMLFPLLTNEDMHNVSRNLGYRYDSLIRRPDNGDGSNSKDSAGDIIGICLGAIAVVVFIIGNIVIVAIIIKADN